jgi:hypothetical protein
MILDARIDEGVLRPMLKPSCIIMCGVLPKIHPYESMFMSTPQSDITHIPASYGSEISMASSRTFSITEVFT